MLEKMLFCGLVHELPEYYMVNTVDPVNLVPSFAEPTLNVTCVVITGDMWFGRRRTTRPFALCLYSVIPPTVLIFSKLSMVEPAGDYVVLMSSTFISLHGVLVLLSTTSM